MRWIESIKKYRNSLENELGKDIVTSLIEDFKPAWILAEEGVVGRALFTAQRPLV